MMIKNFLLTFSFVLVIFSLGLAQSSPVGLWKTIDDKTGKAKSYVEIYEQDGKFFGKIDRLLLKPADTRCDKCSGEKKGRLLVGMVILENLEPYKYYWNGGRILDPESGGTYSASVWFEDDNDKELKVRGRNWVGIYRTQTWYRIED